MSSLGEWEHDDVAEAADDFLEEAPAQEPELYYGSVDEFVREFLVPLYRRRINGDRANGDTSFQWAARWWEYPEAVARLDALWRAWEHLRHDAGLGLSVWFRDHADHHMPILLSRFGPFRSSTEKAPDGDPLPYDPPPPGLYPDVRLQEEPSIDG